MAEDELQRSRSSKYHLVHPTPNNASYYNSLYRSCRFSDHLLAHWVMNGGSKGKYAKYIPTKYRLPQQLGGQLLLQPPPQQQQHRPTSGIRRLEQAEEVQLALSKVGINGLSFVTHNYEGNTSGCSSARGGSANSKTRSKSANRSSFIPSSTGGGSAKIGAGYLYTDGDGEILVQQPVSELHSEHQEISTSRSSMNKNKAHSSSKVRGQSEPRGHVSNPNSPPEIPTPTTTFSSPTATSVLRSRLESGIKSSRAAELSLNTAPMHEPLPW